MKILGVAGRLGSGVAGEVLVGRTSDLVGVWATEAYDLGMFQG